MNCPNCGNEIKNDLKFCTNCGTPLKKYIKKEEFKNEFLFLILKIIS